MSAASVIALSASLQVLLLAGVLGYLLAFSGFRRTHKTIEQAAFVAIFAAPGSILIGVFEESVSALLLALLLGPLLGYVWRKMVPYFRQFVENWLGLVWDNTLPGAWQTIAMTEGQQMTQLTVFTDDGAAYHCDFLPRYAHLPHGPALYGFDGSIAMYVTHRSPKGADEFEPVGGLAVDEFGVEFTYLPGPAIQRVVVRYLTSSAVVAELSTSSLDQSTA